MTKKIIEIEEVDYNNLRLFVGRADLKGAEVPAYIKVTEAIMNAKEATDVKEGE